MRKIANVLLVLSLVSLAGMAVGAGVIIYLMGYLR